MHLAAVVTNDPTTNGLVTAFLLAALGALAKKATDFVKHATSFDISGAVTLIVAWGVGWGTVLVASTQKWLDAITIAGRPLSNLNGFADAVIGAALVSVFAVIHDFSKGSQNQPHLLGGRLNRRVPPPAA